LKNGFGSASSLDDGYYGRGIYFTSDLRYGNMYARETPQGEKVLLMALVVPGNPYPATEDPFVYKTDDKGKVIRWPTPEFETEKDNKGKTAKKRDPKGLYGQACKTGYQSHYTIVNSKNTSTAFPTRFDDFGTEEKKRVVSDELVVFEGAQALPLYLIFYKSSSATAPSPSETPATAGAGLSPESRKMVRSLQTKPLSEVLPGWHGSVSSQEDMAKENEDLAKENEDLRMKLAMLEPKDK